MVEEEVVGVEEEVAGEVEEEEVAGVVEEEEVAEVVEEVAGGGEKKWRRGEEKEEGGERERRSGRDGERRSGGEGRGEVERRSGGEKERRGKERKNGVPAGEGGAFLFFEFQRIILFPNFFYKSGKNSTFPASFGNSERSESRKLTR